MIELERKIVNMKKIIKICEKQLEDNMKILKELNEKKKGLKNEKIY